MNLSNNVARCHLEPQIVIASRQLNHLLAAGFWIKVRRQGVTNVLNGYKGLTQMVEVHTIRVDLVPPDIGCNLCKYKVFSKKEGKC